ncbi:hypothetical protein [Actinoplanes subtropicus]|uniref:hypothetical protein n=1 Tax=Actinoplanes subtropicus TaxID=543632 RepID=UPI0004C2D6F5|nr:hypothetical protein [Actinoplanes subtropicus]
MVILLLLLLIGVGAAVFLAGGRRGAASQELADARAEAHRWYERLGGQLINLRDDNGAARQALTDAAERYQAAGAQLGQARTVVQYQLARETALEGLAYVRAARTALGIDAGPELPPLASARLGTIAEEQEIHGYRVGPQAGAQTPYYYAGGYLNGRPMPAGYYATPWWKTALAAGAGTVGGMLLLDTLFGHHGGLGGGFGHHGGFGGGGLGGPGGGPGMFGGF